ncbi:hypothetical protein STCU_03174 [Strigomonas culicis]|uniref:Uncharacterized protein n=1 Tax=Strigomonas culicis TaxID=28005 RepID=S9VMU3_9TRYP|nr:hypothetical protein STCU_07119 [Strigomonas culicis]EPY31851.1 hypothetical protein STCU_03174 [Strigomonas culicis]|eukprot:EPY24560.1 hypothetical protein STCU_07119 [Strigomonas culicis]
MSTAVASTEGCTTSPADMEKNYEAAMQAKVQSLHTEHGDSHIQKLLQEEIAKVKKMETDLAKLKKKVSAESTVVEDVQAKIRKTNAALKSSEATCHTLQATMKQYKTLTEKLKTETDTQRETLRQRVADSIASLEKGNAEKKKIVEELEAENEQLQKDVSERKVNFEQAYESFKSTISNHDDAFRQMIIECQETASTLEDLEEKRLAVRQERTMLQSNKDSLEQQLALYDTQFSHLVGSTVKRADIEALMKKQKEQEDEKIATLNEEKKKTVQLRIQFDKEAQELRGKLASLRREVQQLERKKIASEKKLRTAQQNVKTTK